MSGSVPDGLYLPRTCTTVVDGGEGESLPLSSFRGRNAYVLLGAPGAGKTLAFRGEASDAEGQYVTVRDFVTYDDRPEWHGATLYIDGLDEKRAGSSDQRTAIDEIRAKLHALGSPPFRLSCREADWFGAHDRTVLSSVAPEGAVDVLRLDPLTDGDMRAILRHLGVGDVEKFTAQGKAHGVEGLMRNPQALEMLVRSVTMGGEWPSTRKETFERSCRALSKESNTEHVLATRVTVSEAEALEVAGRLCAILLLTGEAGYDENGRSADLIPLSALRKPKQEILRTICRTSLFDMRDGCVAPRHRQVAEFLGGRYLAAEVDRGLRVGRALALLTGFDGGVVSELRGLAAWFAAYSREGRLETVERDPLGVVLYGDVKGFPLADKKALISGLEGIAAQDPATLTRYREMDVRWGDLATEDMAPVFSAALAGTGASAAREAVAVALLESLARGSHVPGMAPLLLDAVRDEERAVAIRELSLEAFLNQSREVEEKIALADQIREGAVSDPHDHLLGSLLWHLYPCALSADALTRYFREPKDRGSGWFTHFWLVRVPTESPRGQLEEVMDALLASGKLTPPGDRPDGTHYLLRTIPGRLLWALLEGGSQDARRIFDWLALIDLGTYVEEASNIRGWFAENPNTFKSVFKVSAQGEADPDGPWSVGYRLMTWIGPPGGFGDWCLDEANVAQSERATDRFLRHAAVHLEGTPDWDAVRRRLGGRPELAAKLKGRWEERQVWIESHADQADSAVDEEDRNWRQAWHDGVFEQARELGENRGNAELLHTLAEVYFGLVSDVAGDDPRARLLDLLFGDEELVDAVLRAFVLTAEREDLPTEREILELAAARRSHYLSLPFMAGLEERVSPHEEDERRLRLALAILFNDAVPENDPKWYAEVVASRPELVAQVMVKSARRGFRRSGEGEWGLYRLAESDHGEVADMAVLDVLRSSPTRSTGKRLLLLKMLLRVGLTRRPEELAALVNAKLGSKSMDVAQRMHWLCAGLLTGKPEFVEQLRTALEAGGERRVRHVASFFERGEWSGLMANLRAEALGLLVRSVGASYGPGHRPPGQVHWVTLQMQAEALVREWIERLAGIPTVAATEILEGLGAVRSLSKWQRQLRHARTAQLEARRNATFRHAGIEQVLDTLDNKKPANAADLAAVTVELLTALGKNLRHGNTSDWRQYWTTGFEVPEHEETCRDRLLSDLKRDLWRYDARAEPEGRYAEDKRADIKVFAGGAAVPVEIKKSTHRELWTAIRTQLMANYMPDVEADGYGIYLVLWFGAELCQNDAEGQPASSAEDLRTRLLGGLSAAERRKLSVCVFDVSMPLQP